MGILKSDANVVLFKEGKDTLEKEDALMYTGSHSHGETSVSLPQ